MAVSPARFTDRTRRAFPSPAKPPLMEGQDPNDLALHGQDSNGTVWSICNMNMILHNITNFTIENGDTLENPQILGNGQIRKLDRVLANPPFSQNYSRASMTFTNRFREFFNRIDPKRTYRIFA